MQGQKAELVHEHDQALSTIHKKVHVQTFKATAFPKKIV